MDQWERVSCLSSLPGVSPSRLFFKCPVVDGAELSLCYLGVRDEVYEKTNEITVRKKTS